MTAGDTSFVPDVDTAPMPWSMEADAAPLTFHWSIEDWPVAMMLGLGAKLIIIGGPPDAAAKLTVVDAVTKPDEFVAVKV